MPKLDTLIDDIYGVLDQSRVGLVSEDRLAEYGTSLAVHTLGAINKEEKMRPDKTLYASELGRKCKRQLWYKLYMADKGEKLMPHTQFKFLYGHLLEDTVLLLAKAAGHDVSHEQESVVFRSIRNEGWQVRGKLDAIIDGHVVDVKSMSPFGYNDMKSRGLTATNDKFGYAAQVTFYNVMMDHDNYPYLLPIDKVNGHLMLTEVPVDPSRFHTFIETMDEIILQVRDPCKIPDRAFKDIEVGAKGNKGLCVECSYCEFKKTCWPTLRTFLYSSGPTFLTVVKELPKVMEAE